MIDSHVEHNILLEDFSCVDVSFITPFFLVYAESVKIYYHLLLCFKHFTNTVPFAATLFRNRNYFLAKNNEHLL